MSDNKPWLKHYPNGVPAEITLDPYQSVVDVLAQSVREYTNLPAFTNLGKTISYGFQQNGIIIVMVFFENLGVFVDIIPGRYSE